MCVREWHGYDLGSNSALLSDSNDDLSLVLSVQHVDEALRDSLESVDDVLPELVLPGGELSGEDLVELLLVLLLVLEDEESGDGESRADNLHEVLEVGSRGDVVVVGDHSTLRGRERGRKEGGREVSLTRSNKEARGRLKVVALTSIARPPNFKAPNAASRVDPPTPSQKTGGRGDQRVSFRRSKGRRRRGGRKKLTVDASELLKLLSSILGLV